MQKMHGRKALAIISLGALAPPSLWESGTRMVNVTAAKTADQEHRHASLDLPMSSDYTSLLSGGVLRVLRSIAWEGNHWRGRTLGFLRGVGDPASTIYDGPGDKQLWKNGVYTIRSPDTNSQVFCMD